jgi:hypothetical protein
VFDGTFHGSTAAAEALFVPVASFVAFATVAFLDLPFDSIQSCDPTKGVFKYRIKVVI